MLLNNRSSFSHQNVKTATQATADKESHNLPKKKPAMNEGQTCAQKAVEHAVRVNLCSFFFVTYLLR